MLLRNARSRARAKGRDFSITLDDIKIPETCPLLGIPLRKRAGNSHALPDSPSLDRFDNNLGYTRENVWVVSYRANSLKNAASLEEMKMIASNLEAEMRRRGILGAD